MSDSTGFVGHWPEALRDEGAPDSPFPRAVVIRWFLLGLFVGVLLLAFFFFLELRASRRIVYLASDNQLASMRADGTDVETLAFEGVENVAFSAPQWAPDGSRFATIAMTTTQPARLLIGQPGNAMPQLITPTLQTALSLVGQAWSADSAYVALLGREAGGDEVLALADLRQSSSLTVALRLAPSVGVSWHPTNAELLVSAAEDGLTTTLQIVTPDGRATPFAPSDNQASRHSGTWSPDGNRVAYIAHSNPYSETNSVWVTPRDGTPQQIVADGINFAPVWAPKGDLLFFTRIVTTTSADQPFRFELYRVGVDGQGLQRIGDSTPSFLNARIDQRTLIDWSPDQASMFFQGVDEQEQTTIYTADYDGNNAYSEAQSKSSPIVVRWFPTSSALLVATPAQSMRLAWVYGERADAEYPTGQAPSWQPSIWKPYTSVIP